MTSNALWTAAKYQIPLLIVVLNNRSYYNDEEHQERMARWRQRPLENKVIGIRIEDDVRVTENGCDIYTSAPKTVAEIEEIMRHD